MSLEQPGNWQGFRGDCVYSLHAHVISGMLDDTNIENLAQDYVANMEIEEAVYQSATPGRKIKLGT